MNVLLQQSLSLIIPVIMKAYKPLPVVISGVSCSGKTFFARKLVEAIHELDEFTSFVPLDTFIRDINDPELPRDSHDRPLFDKMESYNGQQFTIAIADLLGNQLVVLPDYDVFTNRILSDHGQKVHPQPIIITEGLFAINLLSLELDANTVIKIYIDADIEVCLKRRIKRDTERFNVSEEKVREMWQKKITPNIPLIESQKQIADIIVSNNEEFPNLEEEVN